MRIRLLFYVYECVFLFITVYSVYSVYPTRSALNYKGNLTIVLSILCLSCDYSVYPMSMLRAFAARFCLTTALLSCIYLSIKLFCLYPAISPASFKGWNHEKLQARHHYLCR